MAEEPARGSGSEDHVEGICGHSKSTAPSGEGLRSFFAHFEASEQALLKVKTFHTRACVSVCLSAEEGGGERRLPRMISVAVRKAWETELYAPQILSRSPQ